MKASQKWTLAAVVALGAAMATLDTTIVSIILSQLQKVFHTDVDTINWVASAYFLAQAAVIPIVGYLSDRLGSKQVFLTALTLFTAASLLCALSPTKEALIAFRILQGIGGGALIPLAFAIIFRIFPPNERSKVVAIVSIPVILIPAFGPTIGGYLSTSFNWNAVFLVNVPIGIVVLLLSFPVLPGRTSDQSEQTKRAEKSFDVVGLLLSIVGVTALVSGISEVASKGWGEATVLTPLLIGMAVLIIFTVVELRVSDPVLDLRLFKNVTFTIANVLIWFIMGVYTGGLFLLPLFFENVQGNTALTSGSFLISQGLATGVGTAVVGVLYNRVGPRILVVFGLLFMVSGTYGLTQIDVNTTGQALQVWLIVRGLGLGFVYQPLQTLALSVVSNRGMAKASSLVNMARQVATATAVAALTTYLTEQTATHGVGPRATAAGIADTFWIVLILSAVCIPLALVIRGDPAIEAQKQAKVAVGQVQEDSHKAQAQGTGSAQGMAPMPNTVNLGVTLNVEYPSRCIDERLVPPRPLRSPPPPYAPTALKFTVLVPMAPIKGIPNVISTLTAHGKEVMGPEFLLWRYPKDNVEDGSLLIVESNRFCVLKLYCAIHNIYETGQHTIHTPDNHLHSSVQLPFSDEPILGQYDAIYINRAKMLVKTTGVTLSREMVEMDYRVDYSIHIANCENAAKLVQHIPHRVHTLSTQDVNAYAKPVIEHTLSQLVQATSLWSNHRELQMQELSQQVRQHLQESLSTYGITLDEVKVLVAPLAAPGN
jgi:EmrB/QacA subfamily drug resistance transporter